jgi:hypothetical protein
MHIQSNMPFQHFAKFLQSYSNRDMIHIKVVFNKTKIAEYTFFGQVMIKKVLPNIKKNKIYTISLLYKEYGDYVETDISQFILFKSDDEELYIYDPIYKNEMYYLNEISDLVLKGMATKKVVVDEIPSQNKKLFAIEIIGLKKKKLKYNEQEETIFNKSWMIGTNDKLELGKLLKKEIRSKYEYDILDFQMDDDILLNDNMELSTKRSLNRIQIVLNIIRKRSLYEKITNKIKEWMKN